MKLIFLITLTVIVGLMVAILRIVAMKRENIRIRAYMDYMEELYSGIEERISVIRKYRHDLSKHICMLEMLTSKDKDSNELKNYLQENKQKFESLDADRVSEDDILDTLLHIKKEECVGKNIDLDISVERGSCGFMEETDKVGLLLNLLDNAIEATERLPESSNTDIIIKFTNENNKTTILLKNSIVKGKKISFITQKKEKEYHGIGTKIIEEIVSKYNGSRETDVDVINGVLTDIIVVTGNL